MQISVEVSRTCPSRITVEFFRTKVTFRIGLYKVCAFKKKRQPTAISTLLATLPAFRREECGFLQPSEASGPPTRRYPIAVVINSHNVARLSRRPPRESLHPRGSATKPASSPTLPRNIPGAQTPQQDIIKLLQLIVCGIPATLLCKPPGYMAS
ncbi:uncharacterized protein LOC134208983 [Armigeres subalbatus]|uniref:uncharacterized protein LOC134208983 n=1 Tax=Armigeres subalbatus TaxID=124917 RepID=UPI002ED4919E